MLKDLNIKVSDIDQEDSCVIITALNAVSNYFFQISPELDNLTDLQLQEYYSGICQVLVESKINEIYWRKHISNKYQVPFDFIYQDGKLFSQQIPDSL